ncbi:sensor histidine kinase [Streptomyces sp. RTd22]|uniref:sensor histidine kinase n=1 Tax=Streptomyces sp. RTd22 TaxID=1841249 RepID=UPI0007C53E21|nr:histidine kinase [Streptomyces sp. RTd22]
MAQRSAARAVCAARTVERGLPDRCAPGGRCSPGPKVDFRQCPAGPGFRSVWPVKTIAQGRSAVAGAAVGAGLSVVSLWWVVPTAVAAYGVGRGRGRTGAAVVVFVGVVSAGVVSAAVVPSLLGLGSRFVGVVVCGVMVPWFVGRFRRQYAELVRAGWERAEQAERERWLIAERARLRERARIAQDMHDVLGHDLSLIALSAGALKLAPGLEDRHRRTAQEIRARAAVAVDRLGEVIGVLREEESPGGIARLVDEAADAGLAVELRAEGADTGLPPLVERVAYRVVQEALTNAAKHAPGATVTVRVAYGEEETVVRVENGENTVTGATGSRARSGGRGLRGLDERVRRAGGSFAYGPQEPQDSQDPPCSQRGGFAVEARIPHTPPEPTAPPVRQEHRRARHRMRRVVVAAIMVPLVTGAGLSAALMGWDRVAASRAVLDPGDFARLRVGQDRSEVERVLPERQAAHHPSAAEAEGRGIRCEYYAMTADRFDDRSGDAYRLCFRGDVLVARDALTP